MIPGVGFFYSGLLRRKNALSLIFLSVAVVGIVSFQVRQIPGLSFSRPLMEFECQWFFWGYSLTFSDNANAFIGDLKYFGLKGVQGQPSMGSTRIPALVFCIYQCMFAAITYVISGVKPSLSSDPVPSQPDPRYRCHRRTRSHRSHSRVHLRLVYTRLQSDCLYDMERRRMVICPRRPRFRWWNSRSHLLWYSRPRDFPLPRKAYRLWNRETRLQTPQHHLCYSRNGLPLVRLVRI